MKLLPGGNLQKTVNGQVIQIEKSHEHLFEVVSLDGVTPRDVFHVIEASPVIRAILANKNIEKVLSWLSQHPFEGVKPDENRVEFLRIYREAKYNRALNRLDFDCPLLIDACSYPHLEATEIYSVGSRSYISLEFMQMEQFLDITITLDKIVVCENDIDSNVDSVGSSLVFERSDFTLMDVINALMSEFYNIGHDEDEIGEDIEITASSINFDRVDLSEESVWDESAKLYLKGVTLDSSMKANADIIGSILEFLPNNTSLEKLFNEVLGGKVTVNITGVTTAYEYRCKMLNQLDNSYTMSEKMKRFVKAGKGLQKDTWYIDDILWLLFEDLDLNVDEEMLKSIQVV